jgi:hypothetical protein
MELGGPAIAALLPQLSQMGGFGEWSARVSWTARTDWMQVGGTRVQVYRLEGRFSERHEVTILVSRAGEIMRVELPGGFSLINEMLVNF